MNERDRIGKRGETVFAYLIGRRCDGRYWFDPAFLDGKSETKDFLVSLIDPECGEATLSVQVKSTTQGYSGKGVKRKLKVQVSKADVAKLKTLKSPTFVAGIDVEAEVGFLLAITEITPNKTITGIPCLNPIDCKLIVKLWKEVEQYWKKRNMRAKRSFCS